MTLSLMSLPCRQVWPGLVRVYDGWHNLSQPHRALDRILYLIYTSPLEGRRCQELLLPAGSPGQLPAPWASVVLPTGSFALGAPGDRLDICCASLDNHSLLMDSTFRWTLDFVRATHMLTVNGLPLYIFLGSPKKKRGGSIHLQDVYEARPVQRPYAETLSRLASAECLDFRESKCTHFPVEAAKDCNSFTWLSRSLTVRVSSHVEKQVSGTATWSESSCNPITVGWSRIWVCWSVG